MSASMTIGEVAKRAGLRHSTLRYYESLGLIPPPLRTHGQRRYDANVLERLAIIRFAKYVGFSLAEVAELLLGTADRPPTERWRTIAHAKMSDLETAIEHATVLRTMLRDTLAQTCPKLVERGMALAR